MNGQTGIATMSGHFVHGGSASKYGRARHISPTLQPSSTPVTSFHLRATCEDETPKKLYDNDDRLLMSALECDASMLTEHRQKESHVGSSDRQADNSFISGRRGFLINGSSLRQASARLSSLGQTFCSHVMVFDVSRQTGSTPNDRRKRQASRQFPHRVYVVKAISENGEHIGKSQ